MIKKSLVFLICTIVIGQQGCKEKESKFKQLGWGGFGFTSQWIGIDSGPGAKLYFKGNSSKPKLIWPYLRGGLAYTNDLITFVGAAPDADGALVYDIFFAAQAPGPAVDISNDILKVWAVTNHVNFHRISGHYFPIRLTELTSGMKFDYYNDHTVPECSQVLTWEQISKMVTEAKLKGRNFELTGHGLHYLKIDYDDSFQH